MRLMRSVPGGRGACRGEAIVVGFDDVVLLCALTFVLLEHVGEVRLRAIDASFFERIVEQTSCRANKWFALEIFFVTGLFADEKNFSATRAFAKDSLRASLPEVAGFAVGSSVTKRFKR